MHEVFKCHLCGSTRACTRLSVAQRCYAGYRPGSQKCHRMLHTVPQPTWLDLYGIASSSRVQQQQLRKPDNSFVGAVASIQGDQILGLLWNIFKAPPLPAKPPLRITSSVKRFLLQWLLDYSSGLSSSRIDGVQHVVNTLRSAAYNKVQLVGHLWLVYRAVSAAWVGRAYLLLNKLDACCPRPVCCCHNAHVMMSGIPG